MKKYYLYTIKDEYVEELIKLDLKFKNAKIDKRPAICLKDEYGMNWLLPVTSLDPLKKNFIKKKSIINSQIKIEDKTLIKCVMRYPDITKKIENSQYKSILLFYKAYPIKGMFVEKFTKNRMHLKAQLPDNELQRIEANFKAYIGEYFKEKPVGFLLRYKKSGADISKYQIDINSIYSGIYKKQIEQQKKLEENKKHKEERAELIGMHKVIKKLYKEIAVKRKLTANDIKLLNTLALRNVEKQDEKLVEKPKVNSINDGNNNPKKPQTKQK